MAKLSATNNPLLRACCREVAVFPLPSAAHAELRVPPLPECSRYGVAGNVSTAERGKSGVTGAGPPPSAADPVSPTAERGKSGVIDCRAQQIWSYRLPSAANLELPAPARPPSAANLELSSASAADQELRPPAEADNSIFAALDADNSIYAALSEGTTGRGSCLRERGGGDVPGPTRA